MGARNAPSSSGFFKLTGLADSQLHAQPIKNEATANDIVGTLDLLPGSIEEALQLSIIIS